MNLYLLTNMRAGAYLSFHKNVYIFEHYHIEEYNLSFSSVFLIAKCFKAVPLINLSTFTSDRNRFFNILCTLSILYEILTSLKRKR